MCQWDRERVELGVGLSMGSTGLRRRERASRHFTIILGNHRYIGESRGHKLLANATTCYTNSGQKLVNHSPAPVGPETPWATPPSARELVPTPPAHPKTAESIAQVKLKAVSFPSSSFFSCTHCKPSTAVVLALRLYRSYSKVFNVFLAFKILFISCNQRREPASCCQPN